MSMKRTWPISSRDLRFCESSISATLEVWCKYLYTILSCGRYAVPPDQPLEQLPQLPLVGLESHVKRDRNQVRVYLRRIITDQRPLEDDGAVDVIPVRQLSVKLAWKWVGESVVHVQEPRRRDEISEPARRGDTKGPLRLFIRLRPSRDIPKARQEAAFREGRETNEVIETGPNVRQGRTRADVHKTVIE